MRKFVVDLTHFKIILSQDSVYSSTDMLKANSILQEPIVKFY